MSHPHNVVKDPVGFYRVEPMPTEDELASFYRDKYYDLVAAGGRAPELQRLLKGGEEAAREVAWLEQTLWDDIRTVLERLITKGGRTVLDIGCGPGAFLRFMMKAGWSTIGVEPSEHAAAAAKDAGIKVIESAQALRDTHGAAADAVTLLNVLEHVRDPRAVVEAARTALDVGGLLVIRVPNDFSDLQSVAAAAIGKSGWWVAPPDHLHYFNFDSLAEFLKVSGFDVVERLADFPMELFLLMGDDYINNPAVGRECHVRRQRLESALPADVRRDLYRTFAARGMGRNALMFARAT